MKKSIYFIIMAFVIMLSACGSDSASTTDDGILVIEERFFIFRMWDILANPEEYLGRTIQYEGVFQTFDWPGMGHFYHVFRYTDDCCGEGGMLGLDVRLDTLGVEAFEDGAWVKVTGVLETFEAQGNLFLRLEATSIVEMEERGAEFVTN